MDSFSIYCRPLKDGIIAIKVPKAYVDSLFEIVIDSEARKITITRVADDKIPEGEPIV